MKKIDIESPVPKYYQIRDILRQMIVDGKLKDREKLDTCRKMANDFETTYSTVNQALNLLDREKLIRRIQGKGIFVNRIAEVPVQISRIHALMTYSGDVYGELFSSILTGLDRTYFRVEASDSQYFCNLPYSEQEKEMAAILSDEAIYLLIDGAYDFPLKLIAKNMNRLRQLTFINRYEVPFKIDNANYVLSDYFSAGYSVGEYLIGKGHSEILFITYGKTGKTDIPEWKKGTYHYSIGMGVLEAMMKNHIDSKNFSVILENDPDKSKKTAEYISTVKFPAIFCCGDNLAMSIYNIAAECRMKIGKDLSVCGFFNTQWAEKFTPALTSVSINERRIGQVAAEIIRNGDKNKNILIKPELIIRQSA